MTTTVSGALVATAPVFTYTERLALGLVHLLYLAPGVPEFSIDWSWLLAASVRRPVALALMAATVAGVRPGGAGGVGHAGALRRLAGLTIGGCLLSMALLAAFWDTVLVIGIDLACW
jgi:hypothetical protein